MLRHRTFLPKRAYRRDIPFEPFFLCAVSPRRQLDQRM